MSRSILFLIASAVLTVWAAATVAFFALAVLPGNAIESQLTQSGAQSSVIEQRQTEAGLTGPVVGRYLRFLSSAVRGDLGASLLSGEPVIDAITRNLAPTFSLALSALVVASFTGVGLGILAAMRTPFASPLATLMISLSLSTPIYWTGTLAIFLFTVQLGLLPSGGAGRLSQLILPVLVLGFHTSGAVARVAQSRVRELLTADFVRAARAKGLPETRVLGVHILRAALPAVISVIALQAGFLFSGTVITESLFVRPGIGRLLLESVIQQDYPMVLGVVVFSALVYTSANLVADLIVRWLDPRVAL